MLQLLGAARRLATTPSQQCRNQLVSPCNTFSLVMSLTLSCRCSLSQLYAYKFDLLWKLYRYFESEILRMTEFYLQLYTILITKIKSYKKSKLGF